MKKYIIILVLTCFSLHSCFDLDVTPQNTVTFESYFKNEKDIRVFMNNIQFDFRKLAAENGNDFQIRKGMYSDDINDFITIFLRELHPRVYSNDVLLFDWKDLYILIQSTNILMEQIHNAVLPKDIEDMYVGQAYFYRAYCYFILAQTWGDAPIVLSSTDIEMRGKEPYTAVIARAVLDAIEALDRIPNFRDLLDDGKKVTTKQFISKEAVYALQTHIYAWEASVGGKPTSWDLAIKAATELLKSKDYFDLAGTPEELCAQALKGTDHKESIFEIDMSYYDNNRGKIFTPGYFATGFPVDPLKGIGDIAKSKITIYNTTVDRMFPKGDLRREAYFYKTDEYRDEASIELTKNCAFLYKYRYPYLETSGTNKGFMKGFDQRRIMYRVADIILLRAEAYANSGKPALAIADLNTIRDRAQAKRYDASEYSGDLKMAIFREREKELLLESQRYWDIARNGYFSEVSEVFEKLTSANIKDGAFYLPVFIDAFADNPMMLQNKYWLSRY